MLDIRWIRETPDSLVDALRRRGTEERAARATVDAILASDAALRAHLTELQDKQNRRNAASKEIGKAKAAKDEALARRLMDEVAEIKAFVQTGEERERVLRTTLESALAVLPNVPLDGVPEGVDEAANVERGDRRFLAPRAFEFEPREHFELGEAMGGMDFETAAKLSGSRFVVLKNDVARLERALGQFMLDLHTGEHGFIEVAPPLLVRDEVLYGTAQLPKFADDQFRTSDGRWLIPTAEVPLTNLVRESILDADALPLRLTALTPCFRSEAGSAGRDVRGMLRQHQFSKVELVSIVEPGAALEEQERMLACAEEVLKRLELPFRVMTLSTGDMGFAAQRTYDIEVWLPGQRAYREISSCSVCGDFQARRMNARYRPKEGKGPAFVHTLNGSGVAVGRALIAVLENHQNADGSVTIPSALRPYMSGVETIGRMASS